jgi:transposase
MFGPGGQRLLDHMSFKGVYGLRVESLRDLLEMYNRELTLVEREMRRMFKDHDGYRAVQAICGVGPVMAAIFCAEIGDIARFPTARHLCSWAGLTPSLRESDDKTRRGHMTKMACGRAAWWGLFRCYREVTMTIIGGLDIHRAQLTFDYVDTTTGEVRTGRIGPANRELLRKWLDRFDGSGEVEFVLEGCTGWRYIVEEMVGAGVTAHVAEPAETAALRGKKSRAKTDRADARHLRQLLVDGRVPESWIPPVEVLDARVLVRLYKDLIDERSGWLQRVHATLFHHGVPAVGGSLMTKAGGELVASAELPPAGRWAVDVGMRQVERLTEKMLPLRRQITAIAARQPGCKALQCHYGIGGLLSVAIWKNWATAAGSPAPTTLYATLVWT